MFLVPLSAFTDFSVFLYYLNTTKSFNKPIHVYWHNFMSCVVLKNPIKKIQKVQCSIYINKNQFSIFMMLNWHEKSWNEFFHCFCVSFLFSSPLFSQILYIQLICTRWTNEKKIINENFSLRKYIKNIIEFNKTFIQTSTFSASTPRQQFSTQTTILFALH